MAATNIKIQTPQCKRLHKNSNRKFNKAKAKIQATNSNSNGKQEKKKNISTSNSIIKHVNYGLSGCVCV